MQERDARAADAGARRLVDQPHAGGPQVVQRRRDVVDAVGDVVQAGPALGEEPADRRVARRAAPAARRGSRRRRAARPRRPARRSSRGAPAACRRCRGERRSRRRGPRPPRRCGRCCPNTTASVPSALVRIAARRQPRVRRRLDPEPLAARCALHGAASSCSAATHDGPRARRPRGARAHRRRGRRRHDRAARGARRRAWTCRWRSSRPAPPTTSRACTGSRATCSRRRELRGHGHEHARARARPPRRRAAVRQRRQRRARVGRRAHARSRSSRGSARSPTRSAPRAPRRPRTRCAATVRVDGRRGVRGRRAGRRSSRSAARSAAAPASTRRDPDDGALDVVVLPAGSRARPRAARLGPARADDRAAARRRARPRARWSRSTLPDGAELNVDGEVRRGGLERVTVAARERVRV